MSNSFEWWHWNRTLLSSIAHSNAIEIEMVANVRMHHPYCLYIRFTLRIRPLIGCMQSFNAAVCVCLCGWSIPSTDIHQFHVESNCWASFCFCFAIFCDPSELWNRIPIYEHRVDNIMQFHLIPFDSIRFVSFPCMCIHPFCYIH